MAAKLAGDVLFSGLLSSNDQLLESDGNGQIVSEENGQS